MAARSERISRLRARSISMTLSWSFLPTSGCQRSSGLAFAFAFGSFFRLAAGHADQLRSRDEPAHFADLDDQPALVESGHLTLEHVLALEQVFGLAPVFFGLRARQREHNVAVVVFRTDDERHDLVAHLQFGKDVGRQPFQFASEMMPSDLEPTSTMISCGVICTMVPVSTSPRLISLNP